MLIPECFDDVANILSLLDKKDSFTHKINYVHTGRWSQCANCGVIYQNNPNRKVGYGTVIDGVYHEIQKSDDPEHWCGAAWQVPRPHDIPAEWTPRITVQFITTPKPQGPPLKDMHEGRIYKRPPDAPYEAVERI